MHAATGPSYVEEATESAVAAAKEDMKAVVTCRRMVTGRTITLRFVKCEDVDVRAHCNDISSTTLRSVMREQRGIKLREALDWMALSAHLLWRCKASWSHEARLGTGCCIKFQESTEKLLLPETPRSYQEPPSFDDPPSLQELGLDVLFESTSSTEQPPLLEGSTSHDISPPFKEPQLPEEPQAPGKPLGTNHRKRRFSATGLETSVETLEGPVSAGVAVHDAEV